MIEKIAVLGAGTMGHSMAEAFAMYGYPVNLYEPVAERRSAVKGEIRAELELMAKERFMPKANVPKTLNNIMLFADLESAVADCDYVIEAAPEVMTLKQDIFRQLDALCRPETILASNTSSLPLSEMAATVRPARRERMLVCHWFNPPHLMPLIEMSYFGNMPDSVFAEVEALYRSIKKQTVRIRKDVAGLIANRIQIAVAREAFSIMEQGIADAADVDRALKFGPAFRYATTGQLEISDFGGLDIWCTVSDNLLKEIDSSKKTSALLREKVKAGKLGLKSGEGFFKYDVDAASQTKEKFMRKLIHQLKASEYYE